MPKHLSDWSRAFQSLISNDTTLVKIACPESYRVFLEPSTFLPPATPGISAFRFRTGKTAALTQPAVSERWLKSIRGSRRVPKCRKWNCARRNFWIEPFAPQFGEIFRDGLPAIVGSISTGLFRWGYFCVRCRESAVGAADRLPGISIVST